MIELINKKENIFGDDISFVENWDFSKANMSDEHRLRAITTVASICYQNPKSVDNQSLYNRLMAESMGLPSSSFEFVPVLIDGEKSEHRKLIEMLPLTSNIYKFGEKIGNRYLLTNYRALIYEFENKSKEMREYYNSTVASPENDTNYNEDLKIIKERYLNLYNTEEECKIIKEHFKVFLFKVDFPTRSQMVRHRVSWQELSRRYVSGKKVPFEFYISEKLKGFSAEIGEESYDAEPIKTSVEKLIKYNENMYYALLDAGVKPQEARRIIPQMGYTQIWGAFQPKQLDNFYKLRLDKHSQWEIRRVAQSMIFLSNINDEKISEKLNQLNIDADSITDYKFNI